MAPVAFPGHVTAQRSTRTNDQRQRLLGPDHPDTLTSRNNLAVVYGRTWQLERAISLLEATLIDTRRLLGPDHPLTNAASANLTNLLPPASDING